MLPKHLLLGGWHNAEDWGCWTSASDATIALRPVPSLSGVYSLLLDMARPLSPQPLTLSINGTALPPRIPVAGRNVWRLPRAVTQACEYLLIGLHVAETISPAGSGGSTDDRWLGIGLRTLWITALEAVTHELNRWYPIAVDSCALGVLGDGWHKLESWGCWSAASDATFYLTFEEALVGRF